MLFEDAVSAAARVQVGMILRRSREEGADAAKLLKLSNALEVVQRIGSIAFGGTGAGDAGSASSGGG
jgi:hypothetical protein